jgi:hypothetical protein
MSITWIPGQDATIDIVWTTMQFAIEIPTDNPVTAIRFRISNSGINQGSLFVDEASVAVSTEISDTERDITYVTIEDETADLPASVRHQNIVLANRHENGLCREIATTGVAGTRGEIAICTADNKFYGCTVTGTPGTWVVLGL